MRWSSVLRALVYLAGAGLFLVAVQVFWGPPAGIVVFGALVGGLTALISLGIALVYRANRILNFAQGDLGFAPASLAVLLIVSSGLSWLAAFVIGIVAAFVVGAVVEFVVIRRFFRAPRLILSVATIGLAQVLAGVALLLPRWFAVTTPPQDYPAPIDTSFTIGTVHFGGNEVIVAITVPVVCLLLALFLRTRVGAAVRGTAENADRASLLGIPVRRLETLVWAIAAVLAFLSVFLRAGIGSLPLGTVLGPAILLRALAAAVIGGMERLPTIVAAAVALGIVDQSVQWGWGHPQYVDPVIFVIVLAALLLTPPGRGLRGGIEPSTWRAVREPRPVPRELARLPEVRWPGIGLVALVTAALVVVPAFLSESRTNLAAVALIYAVIGLSLVVLTGWAGEVSLGQMAFVAIGAAVGGSITARWGTDLGFGLLGAGLVGAAVAALIGVPVLRRRGLTIAVITLAFSLMTTTWLLNPQFFGEGARFDWLPPARIERPNLFGFIDVGTETRYYFLCLAVLGLAIVAVRGIRRSRSGRVLVAIRENEVAASAYGVNPRSNTLMAFALSGFLAALAGALFVHQQNGIQLGSYSAGESLVVFAMVVIGGLGSIPGALLGAFYVRGVTWLLPVDWQILVTGAGLLVVLMLFPGGLGAAFADMRDAMLRRVAARRGLATTVLAPAPQPAPISPRVAAETSTPDAPAAALRVRGLDVEYDGVQVLFGVDIDVTEGEVVAVLGTNGSGKSTLLRAISGLVRARHGTITLFGHDTTRLAPERIAAMGVGNAPGGAGVFPSLTVAEHLRLARWLRRDARAADDELARFPQLAARRHERAGDLSGGEQQLLTLTMALVMQPRLLLVDELTLGLAPAVAEHVVELLQELRAAGTTIVVVEQSLDIALELADRAYFLEHGEVRFVGPPQALLDRPDLVRAVFLGRAEQTRPTAAVAATATEERAPEPRVTADGLSKHYGGVFALDDVSFSVGAGEIVGFVGANGAGKTTLFDVISGFVESDRGTITMFTASGDPLDLTHRAPYVRARRGLGRSFQDGRLFPALTVRETIAVSLEHAVRVRDPVSAALHLPAVARSEAAIAERVGQLVDLLGLDAYADTFVHELSTGTRRLVDLACVLGHEPSVLLLDEPSSGLAQREAEALAPLLLRVRDQLGASVLIIEHDVPLLRAVTERLVGLDLGRVVATGEPATVLRDPAVARAFLGTTEESAP
jgi:ABC-type branched-subunit amino acid transport system ATPase component/ABC-type branched-subunit amino acid transport system permease subunit